MALDLSNGVDGEDVQAVYDGESASGEALDFWVACADDLVSDRLDANAFTTPELRRLKLLVACHFLAAQNPTETEGEVGDASFAYETANAPDATEADLNETRYGRRALALDDTGQLEQADEPFVFDTFGVS